MCTERNVRHSKFEKTFDALVTTNADLRCSCRDCGTDILIQFRQGCGLSDLGRISNQQGSRRSGGMTVLFRTLQMEPKGHGALQQPQIPHVRGSIGNCGVRKHSLHRTWILRMDLTFAGTSMEPGGRPEQELCTFVLRFDGQPPKRFIGHVEIMISMRIPARAPPTCGCCPLQRFLVC
ncbi:hypothetical protein VUR80DRAFT_8289 [Thermomyces stellatus]